jgi:two-component system LytT family response regulator
MNPNTNLQKQEPSPAPPCIILADKQAKYVLPLQSILRLESKRVYTIVYFKNRKELVCCKNIKVVYESLNSSDFFRIHRSHVINMREVKMIEDGRNGKVVLSDNSVVEISQRKKTEFLRIFYEMIRARDEKIAMVR